MASAAASGRCCKSPSMVRTAIRTARFQRPGRIVDAANETASRWPHQPKAGPMKNEVYFLVRTKNSVPLRRTRSTIFLDLMKPRRPLHFARSQPLDFLQAVTGIICALGSAGNTKKSPSRTTCPVPFLLRPATIVSGNRDKNVFDRFHYPCYRKSISKEFRHYSNLLPLYKGCGMRRLIRLWRRNIAR